MKRLLRVDSNHKRNTRSQLKISKSGNVFYNVGLTLNVGNSNLPWFKSKRIKGKSGVIG